MSGVLGSAVLTGFLRHIRAARSNAPEKHLRFIVTTCTAESKTHLHKQFLQDADRISFVSGGGKANVVAMQSADVVFLAFPSSLASTILSNEHDLASDLANKLVVSLLRDVSTTEIDILIDPQWPDSKTSGGCPPPIIVSAAPYPGEGLRIVRRSSLQFIPKDASNTLHWLFAMVGTLDDKKKT
ncbi:predicted protein [Aspergillus nidulans FGSC A4]|uniref:Pyrroline-5-carboxylate reductase catalytic N-terminal domain-containing protein n=1 Tax=Emericella nidulans (strain FGSC A4 / ATCC 38163 / CBS 112.46 / NRRL 194 / M139) TaxID=227321 RepID=Q5AWB3_EMENI|nr:hypothetical protein [Aspergillus nidulans FGSC A4]EAA61788.1 predicted protein [Aspergillus nidulans FGSC A4]CBF78419.1 TPA: conserved hypothetical protein [Aspergillus nidulans FGSC A4]|eukprot:XP_680686.1 predicted protein [Aspergillus nidulans FGSC A4]